MEALFLAGFVTLFNAILKIAVVAIASGILVRRGIVNQAHIDSLSLITVNVLLPCLIFSNIVHTFRPEILPFWWLIPLAGASMVLAGMGVAAILFFKELPAKKNMLPLASMQNAGYLVLPIGQVVYRDQFDLFAMYCFLIILGFSPLLWSLGKYLSTSGVHSGHSLRELATPPLLANTLSVVLVLTDTARLVPGFILDPIDFMGTATIPLATFILGATLGTISVKAWPSVLDIARVLATKFIVIPIVTIISLRVSGLGDSLPVLADLFVIQAAAAPATAIILQVRSYGGDYQKTGGVMFLSYVVCIFAIPFWLAVWRLI